MIQGSILIADDDADVLTAAKLFLKRHFSDVVATQEPQEIPAILEERDVDVIVLDMNFTRDAACGADGFHWLGRILQSDPRAVVTLVTAYADIELAVKAMRAGAMDFLTKPWQNEKLLATVSAAYQLRRSHRETNRLRTLQRQMSADGERLYSSLIGNSPAFEQVLDIVERAAATDANILIVGETGTGKELIAREIHRRSLRAREIFLPVDMGAITASLFESELFGHRRGAFTGASEDRVGRFELASGGTLFLDEIGNLPLELQSRLLTVLQRRTVLPVGGNRERAVDLRLICATNSSLNQLVAQQRFRDDLLYRIKTIEIVLPPLRERQQDIPLLADHFARIFSNKYSTGPKRIARSTASALSEYRWPGNVRELEHAIERAVILAGGDVLQPEHFALETAPEVAGTKTSLIRGFNLEQAEGVIVANALKHYQHNISRAAKALGITRASLYRRVKDHDL